MSTDIKFATNYRYGTLYRYAEIPNKAYDYKSEGLLHRMLPEFLFHAKNPVLTQFLRFIDMQFINMSMYIEKLHKFKNYMK